jgi:hypothetical protein
VLPLAFDYGLYQMLMAVKLSAIALENPSPSRSVFDDACEKVTGLPLCRPWRR